MKTLNYILALIFILSISFVAKAQEDNPADTSYDAYISTIDTSSAGSNLDLQAVAEIFRTSKDLEEFEKRLNEKDGVNNLDLNNDNEVDYLRVLDRVDGKTHVIVIQAVLGKDKFQDVASIDVVQEGDKVTLQLVGDEDIYGTEYYLEPEDEADVKDYPSVKFIFHIGYTPYYSPYYWGYYPPYFRPWPPFPPYYYHRHVYHHYYHHHHYHYGARPMHPHARNVYYDHRTTAPIKNPNYRPPASRPSTQPVPPSTRPGTRPSGPSTQPQKPSTRPSTQPAQKPGSRPGTQPSKPAKGPSTQPTKPASRPSTQPTKPASRPATQPSRPASRPSTQPSRPASSPSARPATTRPPARSYGGGAGRVRGGRR